MYYVFISKGQQKMLTFLFCSKHTQKKSYKYMKNICQNSLNICPLKQNQKLLIQYKIINKYENNRYLRKKIHF